MKWKAKTSWWWLLWLAVMFLPYELYGVFTDPTRTFSWTVWEFMDTHWLAEWAVWGLLGWLVWHFAHDYYQWRKKHSDEA